MPPPNSAMLPSAAALNALSTIEELLQKPGVRVDERNAEGCTALWIAAHNGHFEATERLIRAGAIVDAINLQGETPLYAACRGGHHEVVRILLHNGAGLDHPARSNATPLITAALYGHVQVVMLLVESGAALDCKTLNGTTAQEIAKVEGHVVIHKYLKFQKSCQDRLGLRDVQADRYNQPDPSWDMIVSDDAIEEDPGDEDPSNKVQNTAQQQSPSGDASPPALQPPETSPIYSPSQASTATTTTTSVSSPMESTIGDASPAASTVSNGLHRAGTPGPLSPTSPATTTGLTPNAGVLPSPRSAASPGNLIAPSPSSAVRRQKNELGGSTTNVDPLRLYKDLVRLDAGAAGEVYRGVRRSDGQVFAIKKIPFSSEKELRDLQQEIHMMRTACSAGRAVHTNVIRFYDAHQWRRCMWIVMEFMSGGKLTDIITSSVKLFVDETVIAYLCLEVLKGLQYLHERKIIHRDIKSDNVLVAHDGSVKLGDFGLSASLDKEKRTTVLGTPFWMSPEVITSDPDHPYNESADIWSLGILAVELADGQPPYINEPPVKAMLRIVQQPPPRMRTEAHWSEDMRHFVYSMLQKDPTKRPTAKQLREHRFLRKACSAEKVGLLVEKRKRKDAKPR